jgi:hypothetical protein
VDDPDPELAPALEAFVPALSRELERATEELELPRVFLAFREERRVEDPAALLQQPRLGARSRASAEPVKSACSFRMSARSKGSSASSSASSQRPCPRSSRASTAT